MVKKLIINSDDKSGWDNLNTPEPKIGIDPELAEQFKREKNQITEKSQKENDLERLAEREKVRGLFKPYFRYILIEKIPIADKRTAGGIILAGQKEAKLSHTNKGVVISMGSKAFEFEAKENRPQFGDIVTFTRYEDFIVDHSTEHLKNEYATVYDEYVVCKELTQKDGE